MTDNLKLSSQCQKAAKTAQLALSQIGRAFHYRDRHIFMKLYKQFVRPHLEFAAQAWSPWSEADKKCIESVQQRAVRMVSGLVGNTYEERLLELGMTSLEERRHQADMHQVYKIIKGVDHVEGVLELNAVVGDTRRTRAAAEPLNLKLPVGRLEIRRNFFSNRVPAKWNSIPADIRRAETINKFKQLYKAHRAVRPDAVYQ